MSTLTNGTTIAVTDVQSDLMRQMLGVTPRYGRAVVLGSTDIPEAHKQAAYAAGLTDADLAQFEAYVIEPRESDGAPATAATFDGELSDEEAADRAYVVLRQPSADPLAFVSEVGNLPTAVVATVISKSEWLAATQTREESIVDQFRAELEEDLFLLAADADDDADPGFLD